MQFSTITPKTRKNPYSAKLHYEVSILPSLPFPWIALMFAGAAALAQWLFPLPLLTRLIIHEFGFFLCLIAAGLAWRALRAKTTGPTMWLALSACLLLAVGFLYSGIQLWPEGGLSAALQAGN